MRFFEQLHGSDEIKRENAIIAVSEGLNGVSSTLRHLFAAAWKSRYVLVPLSFLGAADKAIFNGVIIPFIVSYFPFIELLDTFPIINTLIGICFFIAPYLFFLEGVSQRTTSIELNEGFSRRKVKSILSFFVIGMATIFAVNLACQVLPIPQLDENKFTRGYVKDLSVQNPVAYLNYISSSNNYLGIRFDSSTKMEALEISNKLLKSIDLESISDLDGSSLDVGKFIGQEFLETETELETEPKAEPTTETGSLFSKLTNLVSESLEAVNEGFENVRMVNNLQKTIGVLKKATKALKDEFQNAKTEVEKVQVVVEQMKKSEIFPLEAINKAEEELNEAKTLVKEIKSLIDKSKLSEQGQFVSEEAGNDKTLMIGQVKSKAVQDTLEEIKGIMKKEKTALEKTIDARNIARDIGKELASVRDATELTLYEKEFELMKEKSKTDTYYEGLKNNFGVDIYDFTTAKRLLKVQQVLFFPKILELFSNKMIVPPETGERGSVTADSIKRILIDYAKIRYDLECTFYNKCKVDSSAKLTTSGDVYALIFAYIGTFAEYALPAYLSFFLISFFQRSRFAPNI